MRALLLSLLLVLALAPVGPGRAAAAPDRAADSTHGHAQAPPLEELQRRQEEWAARRRLGAWLVVGGFVASVVIVGVVRARARRRQ